MIKLYKYIAIILILSLNACKDKEAIPVETDIEDNDTYNMEILSTDITQEDFNSGVDTSGVFETFENYDNLFLITGSKYSDGNNTEENAYAEGYFFTKEEPIKNSKGKIITYKTRTVDRLRFNKKSALQVPYKIKYKGSKGYVDTLLGEKYSLMEQKNSKSFNYEYDSFVETEVSSTGKDLTFYIPTPKELDGKVLTNTISSNKEIELKWNGSNKNTEIIIITISGVLKSNKASIPFYKISTKDDGGFIVPSSLLKNVPFSNFSKLVFSFIKKINFNANDYQALSQSIHSISVDVK